MRDWLKQPSGSVRVAAAILSVVLAGLLGLAAGARVDELAQPTLGRTGAVAAGFGAGLAVTVGLALVSYQALIR